MLCKLTDENSLTHGNTLWGPGIRHEATGPLDGGLCTNSWIHYYSHPLLAVMLNPIHVNFAKPLGWAVSIEGLTRDDNGLKMGCRALTTLHQIDLPVVTTAQRVRFAILCGQAIIGTDLPEWSTWAEGWLNGTNRAADAAQAAARSAAQITAWAAWATTWAAWATVRVAAKAAARSAAQAAEAAAQAAVWAARATARADSIDLLALAQLAIAEEDRMIVKWLKPRGDHDADPNETD